jgi:DNA-binding transcriptional regulator YiaG
VDFVATFYLLWMWFWLLDSCVVGLSTRLMRVPARLILPRGTRPDKTAVALLARMMASIGESASVHGSVYDGDMARRRKSTWDARTVRALRQQLALTQDELAEELGVRQQTVSEWETGAYRPRGASERLLTIVAERAGFEYEAVSSDAGLKGDEE